MIFKNLINSVNYDDVWIVLVKDRIIDFMNLGFERVEEIIEKSYWYPIKEVRLIT